MNMRELGRERGRKAAAGATGLAAQMAFDFKWTGQLHPTLEDTDMAAALVAYDAERMACEPDYAKFPEMKSLAERYAGEREAWADAGFDAVAIAYHFSWFFFVSRRINARHLARYDLFAPPAMCTNAFIPHSDVEGGIVEGDNRDDMPRPEYHANLRGTRMEGPGPDVMENWSWQRGGASSAVMLDDEPECCFPCDPVELMPDECVDDIHAIVEFMTRYREFYGPGNQLWVDRKLNAVAVEKSTCRVGFRWPDETGAAAITACSYLTPDMHAFRAERFRKAMEMKGETEETSPDWVGMVGSDLRHQRLIDLVNAEAKRGATLWGMFEIMADTKVPFPARICVAGEKGVPDKEPCANWTLTQHAKVSTGANRRTLYRSMLDFDPPPSICQYTPRLALGEGVAMNDEWQADIDAGRCELSPAG